MHKGNGMASVVDSTTVRPVICWDREVSDCASGTGGVFPELVKHANASDGRVATGDPTNYYIRLSHAFEEGVRMGCRERSRVPVAAGFNALSGLDQMGEGGLANVARQLEANPVDLLPHFDRRLFSESGDLWVNLYHEDFAHVHRLVIGDGEGFGFFTLDTGEVVVGRADLTGTAVPAG